MHWDESPLVFLLLCLSFVEESHLFDNIHLKIYDLVNKYLDPNNKIFEMFSTQFYQSVPVLRRVIKMAGPDQIQQHLVRQSCLKFSPQDNENANHLASGNRPTKLLTGLSLALYWLSMKNDFVRVPHSHNLFSLNQGHNQTF